MHTVGGKFRDNERRLCETPELLCKFWIFSWINALNCLKIKCIKYLVSTKNIFFFCQIRNNTTDMNKIVGIKIFTNQNKQNVYHLIQLWVLV
jgi:hypothetical protein